jgi:hypothetical protein
MKIPETVKKILLVELMNTTEELSNDDDNDISYYHQKIMDISKVLTLSRRKRKDYEFLGELIYYYQLLILRNERYGVSANKYRKELEKIFRRNHLNEVIRHINENLEKGNNEE